MTASDVEQVLSDSILYGNVLVERAEDRISARLESDNSVVVTIERKGPRTRKNVPIGTRNPEYLRASVNDREIKVLPGAGRVLKRTYRILVEIDDRCVSFRPKTIDTCAFINGKPHEIEKVFGELQALADGSIDICWATATTIKVLNKTIEPPEPTVEDVLVGCALAAAFGTGALSLTSIIMGMVAAAIPG
ncbi:MULTISPECIES: hypothetical protein [Nocardia]|uniref:Uncharacterized protein n=2 Tax=Nocardia TaxID=1817 RepID=A0A2T2YQN6_9NOCA|nr:MULTISPECIES: hypothetical protein [Nocardia]MBF6242226.1 hypothetical protein [Nocardia elegans]MBF6446943.1 hypothetical protein [Nocardia elegans]PSR57827.1 hypothetical protein C8259_33095 [Nocardia nova]